ncbi:hypothetical protein J3R08_001881 [Micromonospora sp. HB375]|uniref:hypothetical protein n=1 Tax=unclassified Micromonospora TaxID=2617518 RepID=UPI001AE1B9B4|nr:MULTISPECIES: hypothetical protein [unclassified Micromonospora]MBP1782031.1 hypothetical protein [Micromonospora sp. HB375]MDH6472820.1 hypothetical protein [Micromonospora sp. H404/HB375]
MLLAAASDPSGQPLWQVFAVASIPGLAAVIAAIVAGLYARTLKTSDNKAQRIRDLESRISDRKYEIYKPMIETIAKMLDRRRVAELEDDLPERLQHFAAWASIYVSDEALRAFRNFMQASYTNAPAPVFLRLYAEFVLAARQDMGLPETAITPEDLLGIRVNDLYAPGGLLWVVREPFDEVCRLTNWTPPWAVSQQGQRPLPTS